MRTRLSTQERREQLLAIGTRLFAARPYDEVWIDEVAEIAGVSRGLLYHYFATKRDFFEAVLRVQTEHVLHVTAPDPSLPLADRLTKGLDAYLDYVETHPDGYRVIHRAAMSIDEGIRQVCLDNLAAQQERIVATVFPEGGATEAVKLAVHGWLTFVITVCLQWADERMVDRDELRDMCARTLLSAADVSL